MGYIYKIINQVNNKIYIGKTIKTPQERFQQHLKKAQEYPNRYLYDAINHYGSDNFYVETIEECDNNLLNEREVYWIHFYDSTNPNIGYNLTIGGEGGDTWSLNPHKLETGEKIRKSNLGQAYIPLTKEDLWQDIQNNMSMEDMSKKYHTGLPTLRKRIRLFFGADISDLREPIENTGQFKAKEINKNNFLQDIKDGILTNQEIQQKYHIGETSFFNKCKEFTGQTPNQYRGNKSPSKQGAPRIVQISKEQLLQQILTGKQVLEIAEYFKVSKNTIQRRSKEFFNLSVGQVRKEYAK